MRALNMINRAHRQSGASLMEVLIAMSISLVVTASMIAMMSNSLGTTARIIKMTKLTDDMRVALQMMTRDVRRTSFNSDAVYCYGNQDCATDGTLTSVGIFDLVDEDPYGNVDGINECFTFQMDRDFVDEKVDDPAGAFRRVVDAEGIGVLEMWTGGPDPDCTSAPGTAGWVEITNPENMDITAFAVDDGLSYTEEVLRDVNGNVLYQRVRKVRMIMSGELVLDSSITRYMEDVISIRNDVLL